jgi:Flp pilus assembly secretin CpaC
MRSKIVPLALMLTALASGARAANLNVAVDHSSRLPVHGAASVVLGNPGVADVTVVDTNTVYVLGRNVGATDIVVLDRAGRTVYSGAILVGRSGSEVAVYRGVDRTDFTCVDGCSKSEHQGAAAAPAHP